MLVTLDANMSETSFCHNLLVGVVFIPGEKYLMQEYGVYLQLT